MPDPMEETPPKAELTEEEKAVIFRPFALRLDEGVWEILKGLYTKNGYKLDASKSVIRILHYFKARCDWILVQALADMALPEKTEGFDNVSYMWSARGKAETYFKAPGQSHDADFGQGTLVQ
ncbi:hypothetical protein AK812_SmicGene31635 [Symbiodinium microadriaticum]|uniref:Uncharacterized protein n=1 Tax=Symbiodinium microadriaticum TaxID=2951 RepID=A0A1Q9CW74_SYMMI|nr:hypothetical protein AK812_SmicGene31635 [Symbiodinium microadriaticum]